LEHGIIGVCRTSSLKTIANALAKYNLTSNCSTRGHIEPADDYTFFYGNGNANYHVGKGFLYRRGSD
jgi:hypothetical protein